jgi:hypothetical protein
MTVDLLAQRQLLSQSERVRRYVAREMPAGEASEFERALLQSGALQADVEAELLLREHANALSTDTSSTRFLQRPWLGMAATTLLALSLGFLAGRQLPRPNQSEPISAQALPMIMLTQSRGSSSNTITVPKSQVFVARVLTAKDAPHDVSLFDARGQLLRRWQRQPPGQDGFLTLLLPALPTSAQPYHIQISEPSPQQFALRAQ